MTDFPLVYVLLQSTGSTVNLDGRYLYIYMWAILSMTTVRNSNQAGKIAIVNDGTMLYGRLIRLPLLETNPYLYRCISLLATTFPIPFRCLSVLMMASALQAESILINICFYYRFCLYLLLIAIVAKKLRLVCKRPNNFKSSV